MTHHCSIHLQAVLLQKSRPQHQWASRSLPVFGHKLQEIKVRFVKRSVDVAATVQMMGGVRHPPRLPAVASHQAETGSAGQTHVPYPILPRNPARHWRLDWQETHLVPSELTHHILFRVPGQAFAPTRCFCFSAPTFAMRNWSVETLSTSNISPFLSRTWLLRSVCNS